MRKRMVTRTITYRTVTVLGLDTETAEPSNKSVIYTPPIDNARKELAHVKELLETDTYSVAKIVEREDTEKIFGMPEELFLQYATPVTRCKAKTDEE